VSQLPNHSVGLVLGHDGSEGRSLERLRDLGNKRLVMRRNFIVRFICNSLAALLVLAALWCLLWVLSSWDMAFTECADIYGLFSPNPRCRQPPLAGLLALACLIGAIGVAMAGRRFRA
jgi:cell division protein FtsX